MPFHCDEGDFPKLKADDVADLYMRALSEGSTKMYFTPRNVPCISRHSIPLQVTDIIIGTIRYFFQVHRRHPKYLKKLLLFYSNQNYFRKQGKGKHADLYCFGDC